ncbi:unnamed protein product [Cylicocyclus nassatus]|uniref:Uncharacterized protein n=1 Tax=Cylicocyclus nassatus TaxID=53992 RepID=A0AA36MFP5_CYLNA|nr:unnamed protein product [Cylicocyclus nassatus]
MNMKLVMIGGNTVRFIYRTVLAMIWRLLLDSLITLFSVSLILINYALCCRRRRAEPAGRSVHLDNQTRQHSTKGMKSPMVLEAPHPERRVTLSRSDEKLKKEERSKEERSRSRESKPVPKPQQKKISRVRLRRRPSQFTVEGADFSEMMAAAEEMAKECGDYDNLDPNEANDMETAIK